MAGRPSAYRAEYCGQATKLCRLGATDKELADFFGIQESTLNNWKKAHPEFLESIKKGKEFADANIADSLYHRALGYNHPAVKIMTVNGEVHQEPYTEHYPPDTTACIFWLTNRRREDWKRNQAEAKNDDGGLIDPDPDV